MDITYLGVSQLTQDDLVYAQTAQLPGREIAPQDVPYMGLDFTVPGAAKYPGSKEYKITFYSDEEQTVRTNIYNWLTKTFNDATSNGNYGISDSSCLTLALLDMTGNISQMFILHGIYPVSIGAIDYKMTGAGAAVNMDCTLAYQFWRPGVIANLPVAA
jgi:hypothetical protein